MSGPQENGSAIPLEQGNGKPFDVAVIGAGPMGSFTAERLARAGLRVALFEKDARPGDSTVCAGGMHVDLIDLIDLPEALIEKTLPTFRVDISGRITEWHFKERTYFTIYRQDLDAFLARRATEAGAELFTRSRVVGVEPALEKLSYEHGPERVLREAGAKLFVFADGPNSLARRILTDAPQEKHPPQFLGVEYDLAAPDNTFNALEILPDPEALPFGYVWVFPKRDHVNVGLARLNAIEGDSLWKLLDDFVARRPDLNGRRVLRRKGGVIPATLGPVLQRNNCVVVGDAAGMINPLTGGGYVCGFVSATLAAKTCIEAFRGGRFDVNVLRHYPRRLRRTKHYVVMRIAWVFLRLLLLAYRVQPAPVYLKVLNAYFRMFHVLIRFMRVV
jgi:digeranylgeranylglycerophospholipid reductase